jgi:hypothetical protein
MGWQAAPTLEKHTHAKPRALLLACPSGEDNPIEGNANRERHPSSSTGNRSKPRRIRVPRREAPGNRRNFG